MRETGSTLSSDLLATYRGLDLSPPKSVDTAPGEWDKKLGLNNNKDWYDEWSEEDE